MILPETGTFLGKYVYVTVVCSLDNLIMSDLKSKNINKSDTLGSDSWQMVKGTKQIRDTVKDT